MSEEDYKDIGAIKNKWIETKDDYLDMSLNIIDKLQQENKQLKEKVDIYENPEDMTLMFMWCDEKAKDKIKHLTSVLKEIREIVDSYNLGKYDYSIPPNGISYLLEIINKGIEGDK